MVAKPRTKPLGARLRLGDAPSPNYVYRGSGKVDGRKTYMVGPIAHTFDGTCHAACEDVR